MRRQLGDQERKFLGHMNTARRPARPARRQRVLRQGADAPAEARAPRNSGREAGRARPAITVAVAAEGAINRGLDHLLPSDIRSRRGRGSADGIAATSKAGGRKDNREDESSSAGSRKAGKPAECSQHCQTRIPPAAERPPQPAGQNLPPGPPGIGWKSDKPRLRRRIRERKWIISRQKEWAVQRTS